MIRELHKTEKEIEERRQAVKDHGHWICDKCGTKYYFGINCDPCMTRELQDSVKGLR